MRELSSARHARLICIAYALVTGVLAGAAALLIPVSYTHLTLPTNREV